MYDAIIIGGGPGGFAAAQRVRQHGGRVLLIEKQEIGGVCLNKGCIPTKTLLRCADVWRLAQNMTEYGVCAEQLTVDYEKIFARKIAVVAKLRQGMMQQAKAQGIEVICGYACFHNSHEVKVLVNGEEKIFSARAVVIATGSEPVRLPIEGGELPGVIDSDALLDMDHFPKSMLIIGAGAIGIEFASILSAFACQVTVVEMAPTILPAIDTDIAKRMVPILKKTGIKMLTDSRVEGIESCADGLKVTVSTPKGPETVICEKVLSAVGRRPVTSGLGLDQAGVQYGKNGIPVDASMRTNVEGIYAIGDVTGSYMWAHAATQEGWIAADQIMGKEAQMEYHAMPGCIFTTPEIAVVGYTENEAKGQGFAIITKRAYFAANGKAVSAGEADGFVKIVLEQATEKVLGLHIMGPHASDLLMEGTIAVQLGLTAKDFTHVIHPHPSLCETVGEVLR